MIDAGYAHIHTEQPRQRSVCYECGKRRMTIQVTTRFPAYRKRPGRTIVEFLCNECLTKTRP